MKAVNYPFIPRSNSSLQPGQFWAIPLQGNSFACGRVIELPPKGMHSSRVIFLAGLLDWHSSELPNFESIAGAKCLKQGIAHIKTITESGSEILGVRPLHLDKIEPFLFRDQSCIQGDQIQKGFQHLRTATPADKSLPVITTWGYRVIVILAEKYFSISTR